MGKYKFIYKITCLKGDYKGKFYIGQHQTDNLNDGYAGSGAKITEYYCIYGKRLNDTYKFEILKDNIKTQNKLDYWERKYIGKYLGREDCLNIDEGGIIHRFKDRSHTVYLDENGIYHNCDFSTDETEYKTQTFDKETDKLIKQLKKDKFNFEIRKQLTNNLLRYSLTPTLIGL